MKTYRAAALAAAFALLAAGCTSVAPEPSATSLASTAPSVLASSVPSVDASMPPTVVPSTSVETTPPSKTPKPPKSTPAAGSGQPNLVITKFTTDADPFVTGVDTQGTVTIKNGGNADASSFSVGVNYLRDDGLGEGTFSAVPVDGLAAGDSVRVSVNITLQDTGAITFTATADSGSEVSESNEDDNTATLSVNAIAALPNLVFDSFTLTADELNAGGFDITFVVRNAGSADVNGLFEVGFTWAAATGGIGALTEVQCCYADPKLSPGATSQSGESPVFFPSAGSYIVTAALDAASEVGESDETDNYATASVNVP